MSGHAPMLESWVAIDNSDGLICAIGTEERIRSTFSDMERRGTHRIARVVEKGQDGGWVLFKENTSWDGNDYPVGAWVDGRWRVSDQHLRGFYAKCGALIIPTHRYEGTPPPIQQPAQSSSDVERQLIAWKEEILELASSGEGGPDYNAGRILDRIAAILPKPVAS